MEPKVQAYLDRYYERLPAFVYGSRADGHFDENSDWDIGVIGARKGMTVGGLAHFLVVDVNNLDKKAVRNIHNRDISILSRKIEPLKNEEFVKAVERKAKLHIIGYVAQRLGTTSLSGKDIVFFYQRENAELNPFYKPKYLKFLQSEEAVKNASEIYDDILRNYNFTQRFNYRPHRKIDAVCDFIVKLTRKFRESSCLSLSRVLSFSSELISNYSKNIMKDYPPPNPTIKE